VSSLLYKKTLKSTRKMSLAHQVAHNTLIQIIGKIISTILGLFALALITRYLGQVGFGEYTTINTFLTFFAVIADLGLTLVTVQMISGSPTNENKILNNLFSLRLVTVLLFIGLAPLIVIFLPYSRTIKTGVLITAVFFIFPALNQVLIGLFQKRLSMDRAALSEIASRVVLILGVLTVKKLNAGLTGVLIATVLSGGASFLSHYLFALRFAIIKLEFDFKYWKKIISKSWPLAVTIVLNLIYLRADTLVLSLVRSQAEVGLYGAAYKIIDVLTTLPFMFAGLILPILTAAWLEKKSGQFNIVLQKSFDFMLITAVPLVIGAQFLAKPVMIFIAGADFAAAGLILKMLIFAVAAIFLGTIFSHAVIAIDCQRKMIRFYAFTGLSALLGYFLIIPRFSYIGAASITIYSEVLIATFSAYCVFRTTLFRPRLKTLWRSLGAGLAMSLFIYFIPIHYQTSLSGLIVVIIGASILYFAALFWLKGVSPEDLRSILKKSSSKNPPLLPDNRTDITND